MGDVMHFNSDPKPVPQALREMRAVLSARRRGDPEPVVRTQAALIAGALAGTTFIPDTLGRRVSVEEHEDYVKRIANWAFGYLYRPTSRTRKRRIRKKY